MYSVFSDSDCEVLVTSPSRTLLYYLAKIRKGIWKSFAVLLADIACYRTALTACSSASRRMLLLSDLFMQVRIVWLLKTEIKNQTGKKLTNKLLTEGGAS